MSIRLLRILAWVFFFPYMFGIFVLFLPVYLFGINTIDWLEYYSDFMFDKLNPIETGIPKMQNPPMPPHPYREDYFHEHFL